MNAYVSAPRCVFSEVLCSGAKALVLRQLVCTIETPFPVTHAVFHGITFLHFWQFNLCVVTNHDREPNAPG